MEPMFGIKKVTLVKNPSIPIMAATANQLNKITPANREITTRFIFGISREYSDRLITSQPENKNRSAPKTMDGIKKAGICDTILYLNYNNQQFKNEKT